MPTYEYKCERCGYGEEVKMPITSFISDDHWCPECGKTFGEETLGFGLKEPGDRTLKLVVHAPAIKFNGKGFYVNDYPSGSKPASRRN